MEIPDILTDQDVGLPFRPIYEIAVFSIKPILYLGMPIYRLVVINPHDLIKQLSIHKGVFHPQGVLLVNKTLAHLIRTQGFGHLGMELTHCCFYNKYFLLFNSGCSSI